MDNIRRYICRIQQDEQKILGSGWSIWCKGRYHTYGAAVKNEISKEFRLSEDFSLRPYASLKLEYGRVSKIREKSGEMRLDVKANDYFSVKPEIGAELAYRHYLELIQ